MEFVSTVSEMRALENAAFGRGVPSRVLMSEAAEAVVSELASFPAPFAIVCGSGNNGGDGYAVASLLHSRGIPCVCFRVSERVSPDAEVFLRRCEEIGVSVLSCSPMPDFSRFGTVVDCIFGIGFHGELPEEIASVIAAINQSGAKVVAVDIASGLNADHGLGDSVHADLTVSIGTWKPGHFLNRGLDASTRFANHGIGLVPVSSPIRLFTQDDLPRALRVRDHLSNKSTYGYIGLVGGCTRYQGAVRLAAMAAAAMRSGAGVVRLAFPRNLLDTVAASSLESTLFPLQADPDGQFVFVREEFEEYIRGLKAIAFGMGIGQSEEVKKALLFLLRQYTGILIVDADGLNLLSRLTPEEIGPISCRLVLTPHLMEFSRLTGKTIPEIQQTLIPSLMSFALKCSAVVLLKGPCTAVSDGSSVLLVTKGCPGMATAGSGDVLSGITAAVCGAAENDLLTAVAAAAWLNGAAGELAQQKYGPAAMTAGDTVRSIAEVLLKLPQSV